MATPAATVAGALMMGSFVTDMDPLFKWTLAVIAGGGTAGLISAGTAAARAVSTATTGGAANNLVATGELGGATAVSLTALFAPIIAAVVVVVLLVLAVRFVSKRLSRRS
ncbi:MAG: DUF4126 domain-containing protein [Cytophagales bacterium]|nr:DUF4126 domain-containing protein [Cytophagales bacterium]